jgi:hypothetical protein
MLLILFFAFILSCQAAETHEGDKLVGWLGETYKAADRKVLKLSTTAVCMHDES